MNAKTLLLGAVVAALVVGGGAVGYELVAPERSTVVSDADAARTGTALRPNAEVLARGSFTGKAGHDVSGTVELVRDGDAHYLRFENYAQTQGPDVFLYVTPDADPDTGSEVAAGTKVLVDGGADGGESTKQGTFVQRLPDDADPSSLNGVAVWCDRFSVPFGAATLE